MIIYVLCLKYAGKLAMFDKLESEPHKNRLAPQNWAASTGDHYGRAGIVLQCIDFRAQHYLKHCIISGAQFNYYINRRKKAVIIHFNVFFFS
jgi:hypothetical protein